MITERKIAALSLCCIFLHLILRFFIEGASSHIFLGIKIFDLPLWVSIGVGGVSLIVGLLKNFFKGVFNTDLLAGISIITAIILNEPLAASIIVLMLSGGAVLEYYATKQASRNLELLSKKMPNFAYLKTDKGLEQIPIDQIKIGDLVEILPQETCPADGVVVVGYGDMDESFMTGEPYRASKAPGSTVVSGSLNGEVALTIQVLKEPKDSRLAKIVNVMQETAQERMQIRKMADLLGSWYTPFAVLVAAVAWFYGSSADRFLSVLVVATPCPLLIAIPVAIIGSISYAAKRSIIVRDPRALELLPTCKTVILDKTGTLTYGKPTLMEIRALSDKYNENQLLSYSASIEQYSKHPLAQSILDEARSKSISFLPVEYVKRQAGIGLTGKVEGREIIATSRKNALKLDYVNAKSLPNSPGGLESVLVIDGVIEALFWYRDEPRKKTDSYISHLFSEHKIEKVMLVSGDRREEVEYLAKKVGIKDIYSEQSPEDKIRIVREQTATSPTFFLGDGINDAPAMLAATVGVAFGYQSEVTAEAAQVVVMDSSLEKVDELFHIARNMRRIALQSAYLGMGLSVVAMFFAFFGILTPVSGAIIQELIDIIAVSNSLRTLRSPKDLGDF